MESRREIFDRFNVDLPHEIVEGVAAKFGEIKKGLNRRGVSCWSFFSVHIGTTESSIGTYFRGTSMYARVPIGKAPFAVHLLPPSSLLAFPGVTTLYLILDRLRIRIIGVVKPAVNNIK